MTEQRLGERVAALEAEVARLREQLAGKAAGPDLTTFEGKAAPKPTAKPRTH